MTPEQRSNEKIAALIAGINENLSSADRRRPSELALGHVMIAVGALVEIIEEQQKRINTLTTQIDHHVSYGA